MRVYHKYMLAGLLGFNIVCCSYIIIQNIKLPENNTPKRSSKGILSINGVPNSTNQYYDDTSIWNTVLSHPLPRDSKDSTKRNFVRMRNNIKESIQDNLTTENMENEVNPDIRWGFPGDVYKLQERLRGILFTDRVLHVGVVGSSASVPKTLNNSTYAEMFSSWLGMMMESEVKVHNIGLKSGNSEYFSWCLESHLNVGNMDIILIETAGVDYDLQEVYIRNNYVNAGRPLEELTRKVLSSPGRPIPIYVNFPSMSDIQSRNCISAEYFAHNSLAKYYNITTVSWNEAFCSKMWRIYNVIEPDTESFTLRVHKQIMLVLLNNFKKLLTKISLEEIHNTQSGSEFVISSKHLSENLSTHYGSVQHVAATPRKPMNSDVWLREPRCWLASKRQHVLNPIASQSWRFVEGELGRYWESNRRNDQTYFTISVHHKINHRSVVSMTQVSCKACGQALVWLNHDLSSATLVESKSEYITSLVHEIAWNVAPGKHTIWIENLEDKLFRVSAVMVGYKEMPKQLNYMYRNW
ncbi:uncharacterized protein LOC102804973 [Saccoglossus kowalevskii]|uniref:Uncharacterized protein LOC102804973 n=1 Tax=Saccoglossus kowalevskii TaxID=10224 RepID=A0ABM0MI56_SACKO|nr:PREDICTED: uncharacterized protein LOC102804973 [Saccoglossus kowalevskii]